MNINRWSLRSRLTIGIILLSALGFISIFAAASQTLRSYLVSQVDDQLSSVAGGTSQRINRGAAILDSENTLGSHHEMHEAPLQRVPSTLSVTLLDKDGNVKGALGGDLTTFTVTDYLQGFTNAKARATNGQPFYLAGSDHSIRALATVIPSTGDTLVIAQSLDDVEHTIDKLKQFFFFLGLLVLFLMAIASRWVIRTALRPLEAVDQTAEKIAAGDLSARMPDAKPNTEVGRLVTSLNTMLGRIEESFASKIESESRLRRFVADASHELRTPLTAIRGFAELHRQGAVSGEQETKELVARIEGESKRMSALVEDLLMLARMDQSPQMEILPVNISEVVEDVVTSARAASPDHVINLDSGNEIYALGDKNRIHQVVANLLANARIHTPAGTTVNVSVKQLESEVQVIVADNGPGLNDADRARIFERFYRVDPARARSGAEGTGLGLSIVDAVMRAHAGHVSVDSELGVGTTFTLHFPFASE